MTCINYVPKKFSQGHENIIRAANEILNQYAQHGFVLTLRQLYYQFVARDYLPNNLKSYKRLSGIIGEARLAGRIDWEAIEDRIRNLADLQHFADGKDALSKLVEWYHVDMWANQKYRPEVWIEKDALSGVIGRVCQENDVPYFSCRGYTSLSEMWRASMRLKGYADKGKTPFILHFGDHDPSGMDMSRDILDRLGDVFGARFEFSRIALNMDQIDELHPPPNPARVTDPRFKEYREQYGDESWELDALEPTHFRDLIEDKLRGFRDQKIWDKDAKAKEKVRETLRTLKDDWDDLPARAKRLALLEELLPQAESELEGEKRVHATYREHTRDYVKKSEARIAELEAKLKEKKRGK